MKRVFTANYRHGVLLSAILLLAFFPRATIAFAQTAAGMQPKGDGAPAKEILSGNYEGTARTPDAAETKLTLELKTEGGKLSGRLISPQSTVEISEGTFADGKLTVKFGAGGRDGTLAAKVDGDKITGDWQAGTQKRAVELKKAPVAVAAPSTASPANELSGDWDGVADAQGQPFPFLLTLKVDGETVTGSSSSQLGELAVSAGTWKDGKLNFVLESPNGTITMSAVLVEGKLSGDFDLAGQTQGKWVAIRKAK